MFNKKTIFAIFSFLHYEKSKYILTEDKTKDCMGRIKPFYAICIVILIVFNIMCINTLITVNQINNFSRRTYKGYDYEEIKIEYQLESGKVKELYFSNTAVTIKDSEDLTKRERLDILCFAKHCIKEKGYKLQRELKNMEGEFALHVILCKLDYKVDQNEHTDLEYTFDPRWYVRLGAKACEILGL